MRDKARIGFVGLGSMGLPMARNLVAAGHEVAGHDIRPTPMAALCAAGGQAAATACDAARDAGILILMVVDAAQAREVLIAQGAVVRTRVGHHRGVERVVREVLRHNAHRSGEGGSA